MDKQDIQKIVHDVFIKQFKDKAEKATTEENLVVEKQQEETVEPEPKNAKKGNMKRGKKA